MARRRVMSEYAKRRSVGWRINGEHLIRDKQQFARPNAGAANLQMVK